MLYQRRSQRILLTVSVDVSGKNASGVQFNEHTTTMVVNAHGGMILLREPIVLGQTLNVCHGVTGEMLVCTIRDIGPGQNELQAVGIDFPHRNAHFWRVSFPPQDWGPHSLEAKSFTPKNAPLPIPQKAKK
jgi:hypothetical protein